MPPKVIPTYSQKTQPSQLSNTAGKSRAHEDKVQLYLASKAHLFKLPSEVSFIKHAWQEQPVKKAASVTPSKTPQQNERSRVTSTPLPPLVRTKPESKTAEPGQEFQSTLFSQTKFVEKLKPKHQIVKHFPSITPASKASNTDEKEQTSYSSSTLLAKQKSVSIGFTSAAPQDFSYPDLTSLDLTNLSGIIKFQKLMEVIQTEYSYWIPSTWPTPINQRGHCCGLYALQIALQYAHPDKKVPPARKNGDTSVYSLREIAKARGYSSFGEIFNVNDLQKTAEFSGFRTCTAYQVGAIPFSLYKNKLCNFLMRGNSLIVSCDLGGPNDSPGKAEGKHTHWALVFGFFHFDNECQLLVTQYGKYYAWSAKKLYESNLQLPWGNPRRQPYYFYLKDEKTKQESFKKANPKTAMEAPSAARFCKGESLANFQFTFLATSTQALSRSITLRNPANKTSQQEKTATHEKRTQYRLMPKN